MLAYVFCLVSLNRSSFKSLSCNTPNNMESVDDDFAVMDKKKCKQLRPCPFWGSARMTYTICAFISMTIQLCMRNTLSFVVLCIAEANAENEIQIVELQTKVNSTDESLLTNFGGPNWTRSEQIFLLGTFYYGYVFMLPFAGRLADVFGGKILFVNSITMQAVVYLLFPFCAQIDFKIAVLNQVLQGLIAGCGNPALYKLFLTWAHPSERTALLSVAYMGYSVGVLITFPLSSILCNLRWDYSFYIIGTVSFIFGMSSNWFIYNSLETHPRLSTAERDYLMQGVTIKLDSQSQNESQCSVIPWRKIIMSKPVHAFIFTHIFHTYGLIMLTQIMPRYLTEAMNFPLSDSGYYASSPFLGGLLGKCIAIVISRYTESGGNISVRRRMIYGICGSLATIIVLITMVLDSSHRYYVIALMVCFGLVTDLAFSAGYWPSLLFFAPSYAGLLSGFATAVATCSGFVAPIVVANLVTHGTVNEWNYVFLTMLISSLLATVSFGCWGSSKMQSWNNK